MPTHAHHVWQEILTSKLGRTDLVMLCNQGSLVSLCKQDYKSLCAAVTIYARRFVRSGLNARAPECQKFKMMG